MAEEGLSGIFESEQPVEQETDQAAGASESLGDPGGDLPAADDTPAQPTEDKTEKTAPEIHGLRQALTEERTRRQQYEHELRAALAQLQQPQQPAAQPQQPAFEEDPRAYVDHQAQSAQQKLQEHERYLQLLYAQQQQQQQVAAVTQQINTHEADFVKNHDDYYQAIEFLRQMETRKLQSFGVPKDQIAARVSQALFGAAHQALATGKNPAEVAYSIANVYGWEQAKKLAQIARGQQQAKGPGSTGVMKDSQKSDEEDIDEFGALLAELN